MASNLIEDIIFFGLALNERAEGAEHRLKTDRCPTMPELERLAKLPEAGWNLKQLLHTKVCPYCQLSVKQFRRVLGNRPWWEQWGERAQLLLALLQGLSIPQYAHAEGEKKFKTSLPSLCTVPAVVVYSNEESKADVEIVEAEATPDECMRLTIRMKQIGGKEGQLFNAGQMPVELTLVAHETSEPLGSLLLPELINVAKENFKVQLPRIWHERLKAWRDRQNPVEEFPLRFVLRPGDGGGVKE